MPEGYIRADFQHPRRRSREARQVLTKEKVLPRLGVGAHGNLLAVVGSLRVSNQEPLLSDEFRTERPRRTPLGDRLTSASAASKKLTANRSGQYVVRRPPKPLPVNPCKKL